MGWLWVGCGLVVGWLWVVVDCWLLSVVVVNLVLLIGFGEVSDIWFSQVIGD